MTTELLYLFLTSVLLAVLWIPHIVGQVKTKGPLQPDEYVNLRESTDLPAWVRRANRAHVNLVEQFGPFAGLIVVAHLAGISTFTTAVAAAVFFWSRVVHAVIMLAGFNQFMARTLVFTVAFLSLLVLAVQIAANM